MQRTEIADHIVSALARGRVSAVEGYVGSEAGIGHFFVDDVLPNSIARKLYDVFPTADEMTLKRSLREDKFVSAQMDRHNSLLEEALYAFQDARVVAAIGEICGIDELEPDVDLYAGGLSAMERGQFLNPHLDNSHDKTRSRWRVLNLLYYVTPEWPDEAGGALELWPDGLSSRPIVIPSRFNRLTVMATHDESLHSVNEVKVTGRRCCISNYYFSKRSLRSTDQFHVTSFRGRPEQPIRDAVLRVDAAARGAIRKVAPNGLRPNPHFYDRPRE